MSDNANSKVQNQLVVQTAKPHKIFSKFKEYLAAVRIEKEKVKESKAKIHSIEEELKKLMSLEAEIEKKEIEQKEKVTKKLVVKKQPTKKPEAKKVDKEKKEVAPVVIKKDDLVVVNKEAEKNEKSKSLIKEPTKPAKVNYDELYAIEIETLKVAFDVLPNKEKKEFNKNIYKMIDKLIEMKYIDKRH